MSAEIEIDDCRYVLASAVPYITKQFFTVSDLVQLVVEPRDFCTPDGYPLDVYLWDINEKGQLVRGPFETIKRLASELTSDPSSAEKRMQTMVVNSDALEQIFFQSHAFSIRPGTTPSTTERLAAWDIAPMFPDELQAKTDEYIQLQARRRKPKRRVSEGRKAAIRKAYEAMTAALASKGVLLDKAKIPGTKRDFIRALNHFGAGLEDLKVATVSDEYFDELGFKFSQGTARYGSETYLIPLGLPVLKSAPKAVPPPSRKYAINIFD